MASLVQLQKVSELEKEGYKIIGPKMTGGGIPMGGPTLLQSPDGRTVEVLADGSVNDPYKPEKNGESGEPLEK